MNQIQYFNKAKDIAKRNENWMDFLTDYPPRNNAVSAKRLGQKLAKIFHCTTAAMSIQLYLMLVFNLKA